MQENKGDIDKINGEWKGRYDRVVEEYTKRLEESEENASIKIATAKAESHSTLQQKDQEIERWINKCNLLKKSGKSFVFGLQEVTNSFRLRYQSKI